MNGNHVSYWMNISAKVIHWKIIISSNPIFIDSTYNCGLALDKNVCRIPLETCINLSLNECVYQPPTRQGVGGAVFSPHPFSWAAP